MTENNDQNAKATADCAPMTCSAASASIIEIYGVVVGCDADELTITVQIPMRPSGVMLGDDCWLKWKRHPLTPPNAKASNGGE